MAGGGIRGLKVHVWSSFSQAGLAQSTAVTIAVIHEVCMNFLFQLCGGQDGLEKFSAMEYLCVE